MMTLSAIFLASFLASTAGAAVDVKVPILLDTDIGDDIDDAFALGLVLVSPQLELRGVTTVHGDAFTRAVIVRRFLHAVGRDVPVAAGQTRREQPETKGQFQYGLRPAPPAKGTAQSAVDFLYRQLQARPGELTLLAVGPLTNIAALLREHPDCRPWIKRIVVMGGAIRKGYDSKSPVVAEWNIRCDVKAAQAVFASGVPLTVVPLDATVELKLGKNRCQQIFASGAVGRELGVLYQLWEKEIPTLFDPLAAAVCCEEKFVKFEELRLVVDDEGITRVVEGKPNARVAVDSDRDGFLTWFVEQFKTKASAPEGKRAPGQRPALSGLVPINTATISEIKELPGIGAVLAQRIIEQRRQAPFKSVDDLRRVPGLGAKILERLVPFVTVEHEPRFVAAPVGRGAMPSLIHVIEDYETDIERRWWLCGKLETANVPPDSKRACRGVLTNDFDERQGNPDARYSAVIFNPVPGPPMGPNPRLSFRYWLKGSDVLRVQIYSLTRGYHRQLLLTDLPERTWQAATVDMTVARRPDGSGGPLSAGERIDDIQFYADPSAELLIDDIVLYDAATPGETRPFPRRPIFSAWFDTGRQGKEWPGAYEIVRKDDAATSKAAQSVPHPTESMRWLRVELRGPRSLGAATHVHFHYRLVGADSMRVALMGRSHSHVVDLQKLPANAWTETTLDFSRDGRRSDGSALKASRGDEVDALEFLLPPGAQLQIDDVLLYEPAPVGQAP